MSKIEKMFDSKFVDVKSEDAKELFVESITLLEQLHQKLHDLLNHVLVEANISDLTAVQALLIYNLGKHEIMVGELRSRGFYLGSNVSYNLKKLVQQGYIAQKRLTHDKRAVRVSLTEKGHNVRKLMGRLYDSQIAKMMQDCPLEFKEIRHSAKVMDVWNQFWSRELITFFRR